MRPTETPAAPILVVDDDPVVRRHLTDTLTRAGYAVVAAATVAEALRLGAEAEPALAILDLVLPDGDGIELLGQLRASWPGLPAIIVTAYVEPRSIVEAMRRGALDYLGKPLDPETLLSTCRAALARRPAVGGDTVEIVRDVAVVGASPEAGRIREVLGRLARTRTVGALITGERGTGKTYVAHALHAAGHRRQRPCLPYPCAECFAPAVALFGGTTPGSGLMAAAAGGTVILDDVDRLDDALQRGIVEWMEHHRTAAPLLIGTTTNPAAAGPLVAWLGRARLDLPPLRERTADIVPLARHFLEAEGRRLGRTFTRLTPEAQDRLIGHGWPGNVRELEAAIQRIAVSVPGGAVGSEHLTVLSEPAGPTWLPAGEPRPLRDIEDAYIDHVIALARGNKTRAAQLLGIARETLRSRLLARGTEVSGGRSA
jgi:DNA-binding NtrC family response regulator